jgi:hypothetical protein
VTVSDGLFTDTALLQLNVTTPVDLCRSLDCTNAFGACYPNPVCQVSSSGHASCVPGTRDDEGCAEPICSCVSSAALGYTWPSARCGQVLSAQCPGSGRIGFMTRTCNGTGFFAAPSVTNCASLDLLLASQSPTITDTMATANLLKDATNQPELLSPADVVKLSSLFDRLNQQLENDPGALADSMHARMTAIANVLEAPDGTVSAARTVLSAEVGRVIAVLRLSPFASVWSAADKEIFVASLMAAVPGLVSWRETISTMLQNGVLETQLETAQTQPSIEQFFANVRAAVAPVGAVMRQLGAQRPTLYQGVTIEVVRLAFVHEPLAERVEAAVRAFANTLTPGISTTTETGNLVYGAVSGTCSDLTNYVWTPETTEEDGATSVTLPGQTTCSGSEKVGILLYRKAAVLPSQVRFSVSRILSVSYSGNPGGSELAGDVVLRLALDDPSIDLDKIICGYYDFALEDWATKGCRLDLEATVASNASGRPAYAVCRCNHTTHFSVLTGSGSLGSADEFALSVITYIGLALSIPMLAIMFVAFLLVGMLQTPTHFHMSQLCLSLGIALLLFVIGADRTEHPDTCTGVAVALHYFLLVSFAWMLLNGVLLYRKFCRVMETVRERARRGPVLLLAWGVPAVVVAISAGVRHDAYGSEDGCWIENGPVLWGAFLAPVGVVIAANVFFFVMILRVILRLPRMAHMSKSQTERTVQLTRTFKAFVVLLPVMGGTWIFAYLTINNDQIVLHYLFTIFCSIQGLLIFIFHFVLDKNVQTWFNVRVRKQSSMPSGGYDRPAPSTGKNYESTGASSVAYSSASYSTADKDKAGLKLMTLPVDPTSTIATTSTSNGYSHISDNDLSSGHGNGHGYGSETAGARRRSSGPNGDRAIAIEDDLMLSAEEEEVLSAARQTMVASGYEQMELPGTVPSHPVEDATVSVTSDTNSDYLETGEP